MKILLIAPTHPDLPSVVAEIAAISRYHEVERVIGDVRDVDIQRAIDKGDFDVLWFATHGNSEGVQLSASILSAEGIGQYVATSGVKLCVLNTCASEDVANRIIAGGDADMVFTVTEKIADEDALRFGSLFAGELAKSEDFEAAFKTAAGPGPTKYRYLNAKAALRGVALQASNGLDRLEDKVDRMEGKQYDMEAKLQILTDRFTQATAQALLTQQQALQTASTSKQTADLDRSRVERQLPPPVATAGVQLTPTFWALILLIVLLVAVVVFFAGRSF